MKKNLKYTKKNIRQECLLACFQKQKKKTNNNINNGDSIISPLL